MSHSRRIDRSLLTAAIVIVLLLVGITFIATRAPVADEFIESLTTPVDRLTLLVHSPDGRFTAAGSANGEVVIAHHVGDRVERLDSTGESPLTMLAFVSDEHLMSGDRAGLLWVWQVPDFEAVELDESLPTSITMTCAAFRPVDSSLQMILGLADGRLVTIDESGTRIRKSGHRGVKALTLSEKNATLITAGTEGKINWHDLVAERASETHTEHETEVSFLVLSPDGSRMASADWDGKIRVWDTASRKVLVRFEQSDAVSGLAGVDDLIVTGSWDGQVRVWHVTDSAAESVTQFDTGRPVHALTVEAATERILTVSGGDSIDVWRLSSPDGRLEP